MIFNHINQITKKAKIKYLDISNRDLSGQAYLSEFTALTSLNSYNNKFEKPQAFIALGCVLRGGTPHFDYVCKAITDGVVQLNLTLPVPTIFGVLTVDNQQQADERTGGIHGNKGEEAALTALKMITLKYSR